MHSIHNYQLPNYFGKMKNMEKVFLGVEAVLVTAGVFYLIRRRWTKTFHTFQSIQIVEELEELEDSEDEISLKKDDSSEQMANVPGYLTPDDTNSWNTAIFFPDPLYKNDNSKAMQLIWYLRQTQKIIKICMCTSNFKMFEQALYDLIKNKGIRVIGISNGFRTAYRWKKNGIMARENLPSNFLEDMFLETIMHHKFIILDDKAIMTGSLNWSTVGVTRNKENVVITTHENIVSKYVEEFERLWQFSKQDRLKFIMQKERKSVRRFNITEPREGVTRMQFNGEEYC